MSFSSYGPAMGPSAPLPYKPFTLDRLTNVVGGAYNLSNIQNMNTIPSPRAGEQQIFFVDNDDRIYSRQFDNSLGIIGYKQEYVSRIEQELSQAQSQLHQIFESVAQKEEPTEEKPEETTKSDSRVDELEKKIDGLFALLQNSVVKEEKSNGLPKNDTAMAAVSELAKAK